MHGPTRGLAAGVVAHFLAASGEGASISFM
jgi:hypothetical protein